MEELHAFVNCTIYLSEKLVHVYHVVAPKTNFPFHRHLRPLNKIVETGKKVLHQSINYGKVLQGRKAEAFKIDKVNLPASNHPSAWHPPKAKDGPHI
jgi:hypothetical protein